MASISPVILILGAGGNIGHHVARAFAARGYKVALAARSLKEEESTPDRLNIRSDLSDPNSVVQAFAKVKAAFGLPSVVVYNGNRCPLPFFSPYSGCTAEAYRYEAAAATANDAQSPLTLSSADFIRDLNVNTTSAFVAAQQALQSFETLPSSAARTFIYTGNILNTVTMARLLDLGVGKSATAHIIESASAAYSDRGFK